MDDTTTFADMASELGLPKKLLYSVKEVSMVLGVPCSTVYDEMKSGRLRYHLPPGRKYGQLVKPNGWMNGSLEVHMTKVEKAVFTALAMLGGVVALHAAIYMFVNLTILVAKALGRA